MRKLTITNKALYKQVTNNNSLPVLEQYEIVKTNLENRRNIALISTMYKSKTLNSFICSVKGVLCEVYTVQDVTGYYNNNFRFKYSDIVAVYVANHGTHKNGNKDYIVDWYYTKNVSSNKYKQRVTNILEKDFSYTIKNIDDVLASYIRLYKYTLLNRVLKTNVEYVSNNGMSRHITVYTVADNDILRLVYGISKIKDGALNREGNALLVGGCGMDMCFSTVYNLSYRLYSPFSFSNIKLSGSSGRDGGYYLDNQTL